MDENEIKEEYGKKVAQNKQGVGKAEESIRIHGSRTVVERSSASLPQPVLIDRFAILDRYGRTIRTADLQEMQRDSVDKYI